jgi:hypothetical protein
LLSILCAAEGIWGYKEVLNQKVEGNEIAGETRSRSNLF